MIDELNPNIQVLNELKKLNLNMTGQDAVDPSPQHLRFIYCTIANDIVAETLIGIYGLKFNKYSALQTGLDEYQISCGEQTYDILKNRIIDNGLQLYISNNRLPIQGAIGSIAVSEGVVKTATHSVATMGVASATVLVANPLRLSALIINDSDTVIYITLEGTSALLNTGVRINPNGGSYAISKENGNLTLGIIKGIAGVATKKLLVTEFVA